MRFPDDKEEKENQENINGAECERKQGNDEGRHCKQKGRQTGAERAKTNARHTWSTRPVYTQRASNTLHIRCQLASFSKILTKFGRTTFSDLQWPCVVYVWPGFKEGNAWRLIQNFKKWDSSNYTIISCFMLGACVGISFLHLIL